MGEVNWKPAVWIDFENAPHVWVLSPIIEYLRSQGYPLILTARDFSCTVGLCHRLGYDVQVIGQPGPGKTMATKMWRLLERASRLYMQLLGTRKSIALALSHGSRSQVLAAHYLGIPVVSLDDYEFSNQSLVRFVDHLLVPFPIPKDIWGRYSDRVRHYPGLKEELYLCNFEPDQDNLRELDGIDQVKVLFRPEGRFAHYRSAQSEALQKVILNYLAGHSNLFLVPLPRDAVQAKVLVNFCEECKVPYWLPEEVLDGPALIWKMDVVVSGGGTMTREAAVLSVPSYSFFAGQWGAVDRYLETQGRLVRLCCAEDVNRIVLKKRDQASVTVSSDALEFVIGFVEDMVARR